MKERTKKILKTIAGVAGGIGAAGLGYLGLKHHFKNNHDLGRLIQGKKPVAMGRNKLLLQGRKPGVPKYKGTVPMGRKKRRRRKRK